VLIVFCAALGVVMSRMLGIDPLTAYLATSPGGMDSVAIIAAASNNVDLSFVMAMQMARFLIVMVAGPPLARMLARRVGD
jgi:membrane AbrB-like protein